MSLEKLKKLTIELSNQPSLDSHDPFTANSVEDLMRVVLDKIPAMIWVKRVPDGFIMLCNDAAAKSGGTTKSNMNNTLPETWWPESFTKKWLIDDNEVAATACSKVNYLERLIQPKSKQIRWVRTSKYPIIGDNGEVEAVLVFSYDVTEIIPPEIRKQG